MDDEGSAAVPGWYADPGDASLLRYWDGEKWTEKVGPRTRALAQPHWIVDRNDPRTFVAVGVLMTVFGLVFIPLSLSQGASSSEKWFLLLWAALCIGELVYAVAQYRRWKAGQSSE